MTKRLRRFLEDAGYFCVDKDSAPDHIVFNRTLDRLQRLEEEGTVMVLRPSEALKSGTYDMNPAENQKLYDLGMKDYDEKRTELFEFLQKKN